MIMLKNSNGVRKKAPQGFSFTVFFFGFLPMLFRGDFKHFGIVIGLSILMALINLPILAPVIGMVYAFKYNEWYLNDLLNKGYEII